MASTNSTSHYNLSQYVSSDKPTYLVDYNGDMQKIDAGIYSAESKASVNEGAIGDLTDLDTTAKSDLVSAVNEVNTQVGTNTGNISTNTSNISTLGGEIGTMANLTTTDKTSLVNAVNEVNAVNGTQQTAINKNASDISDLIDYISLTNYVTVNNGDISCNNGTISSQTKIRFAYNNDYSVFKLYGVIIVYPVTNTGSTEWKITFPSSLRPSTEYTIQNSVFVSSQANASVSTGEYPIANIRTADIKVKTDGTIEITSGNSMNLGRTGTLYFPACLYFNKDFGD